MRPGHRISNHGALARSITVCVWPGTKVQLGEFLLLRLSLIIQPCRPLPETQHEQQKCRWIAFGASATVIGNLTNGPVAFFIQDLPKMREGQSPGHIYIQPRAGKSHFSMQEKLFLMFFFFFCESIFVFQIPHSMKVFLLERLEEEGEALRV